LNKLSYKLSLFFLALTVSVSVSASIIDEPFVLVLDAGHGGKDSGAISRKTKEKNINLAVTLLAGKYIAEKHPDVRIIYTRDKDEFIGLNDRANVANKSKANLFISIHANSSEHSYVRGVEVYTFGISRTQENLEVAKRENSVIFLEDNYEEKYEGYDPNSPESFILFEFIQNKYVEQSINFASSVRNEMKNCVKWKDRGVKQAEYLVLRKSSMPRILIELDFLTNPDAESFLTSEAGQRKYAKAICNAFTQYKRNYDRKNRISQVLQPSQRKVEEKEEGTSKSTIGEPNNRQPADKASSKEQKQTAPKKVVYKVQIVASPKALPAKSPLLKGYKADYYIEDNLYKYTYGESTSKQKIFQIRKSLLKDFRDAFVIVFEDGVKVQNK
jgi:N-acetylmuramoyl-L-alanine amidase